MKDRRIGFSLYIVILCSLTSCKSSLAEHGLFHQASIQIFEWIGVELFDANEQFSLKDVHLDGSALLNHDVLVGGKVETVGAYGTFVIISDDRVRMLIDLSHLGGAPSKVAKGDTMRIIGKVQSGENGHFYLVANAVSRG